MAETINYDELTARQKKKYNKLLEKKKKTGAFLDQLRTEK